MSLPRSAHPVHQERSRATLARLLDAAEALLQEGGLEGATVEAIARRAGVSPALVYRRFPDKDALLRAVYERFFAEREAANAEALAPERWAGHSPEAIVRSFVLGAVEGAARTGRLVGALTRFAATHGDAAFRAEAERVNAATHQRLTRLLISAAPDELRKGAAARAPFAVDVLLFALRGFLVDASPPSGGVPDAAKLARELAALTGRYLSDTRSPGEGTGAAARAATKRADSTRGEAPSPRRRGRRAP